MSRRDKTSQLGRRGKALAIRWIPVALLMSELVSAQQSPSPWVGEWGQITQRTAIGPAKYVGGRVDISDCSDGVCRMQILTYSGRAGYCCASADLTTKSPLAAEATLDGPGGKSQCVLALKRSNEGSAINAAVSAGVCSSFCAGVGSFQATFPFRQKTPFVGNDINGCFVASSRARSAICADNNLAKLEEGMLEDLPPTIEDGLLRNCEKDERPADCLRKAFTNSIAEIKRMKRDTIAEATAPGDPGKADTLIDKIMGEYRASVENGDVSGAKFTTTDSMTIERASKTSIRYSVNLSFYNGHSCSRTGVAAYGRNGSFVDHTRSHEGECYFEIIPTAKGISFADPGGICRLEDCGTRGGFDGEGFTFAQNQSANP